MSDDGTCDVSIGEYDGDPAEFFHTSILTARKGRTCDECGEPIAPTQQYERIAGKWDGAWSVWRLCLPCRVGGEFAEGGRIFGGLWDDFENNWEEGAHLQACLNRLSTVAAKELMVRRWRKWKQLA